MKVKDLIEALQGYDPEMEVLLGEDHSFYNLKLRKLKIVEVNVTKYWERIGDKVVSCEYRKSPGGKEFMVLK